jgi:hypothetical protein
MAIRVHLPLSAAVLCLLLLAASAPAQFFRAVDFTGVWKLEMSSGGDPKAETLLKLKMTGKSLAGTLKTPHGEFPIENGSADGDDLFFNVVIKRDEYALRTTYRGHLFSEEIQFTVEAGERMLQMIGRRAESKKEPPK